VAPRMVDTDLVAESGPATELLPERIVPLGGLRSMLVRRTLPQRQLPSVGAWCFLDHFGPEPAPMQVLPHPHMCLQTVTWPFTGTIRHRDSLGSDVVLRPGELNLMTSGAGVSHSEMSVQDDLAEMHGLQLWVASPERTRHQPARFEHHSTLPVVERDGIRATILVGEFMDGSSPAQVDTPLVGVDLTVPPGTSSLSLTPQYEHAVMVIAGAVEVAGKQLTPGPLLYLGTDRDAITVASTEGAHLILLGGEPFEEELVMWWNFIGRSHEEIVQARDEWEAGDGRFGVVSGHDGERIPAPPLPGVKLRPRRRRPAH